MQHDAKIYKWNSKNRLRVLTRWRGTSTLQPVLLLSSVFRKVALRTHTHTTVTDDRHHVWIQLLNWNSNFIHPSIITATLFQRSLNGNHKEHTATALIGLKMPSVHARHILTSCTPNLQTQHENQCIRNSKTLQTQLLNVPKGAFRKH